MLVHAPVFMSMWTHTHHTIVGVGYQTVARDSLAVVVGGRTRALQAQVDLVQQHFEPPEKER